jgi:hypothetical protein
MSRSKREPYWNERLKNGAKFGKRKANKTVRQLKKGDLPKNGAAFKKEHESWDIKDVNIKIEYPNTLEQYLKEMETHYKRPLTVHEKDRYQRIYKRTCRK